MADNNRGQHTPGMFVWRELYTPDTKAAKNFYGEVLGWRFEDVDMGGGAMYTLAYAGDKQIAGMFSQAGIPTMWNPYVSVTDVDAATKRATDAGGQCVNGPMDIPNIGRMSTVIDPQGADVSIYRAAKGDSLLGRPSAGEFCWESLNSTDLAASKTFYANVFEWQSGSVKAGDVFTPKGMPETQCASVNPAPPGAPASWLSHILVKNLTEASDRAKRNGGKVLMDKVPVTGMGEFSVVQDPQGAVFSLFAAQT
ncbi:MAG: VOC family protein [Sandaracinaceae bacterium]|jgi:predicted enzyme related to lactoylglutathione lyase|nr:VOC family protein [Sandaracinaceae bacterium]